LDLHATHFQSSVQFQEFLKIDWSRLVSLTLHVDFHDILHMMQCILSLCINVENVEMCFSQIVYIQM
jgi:hypothetical protein